MRRILPQDRDYSRRGSSDAMHFTNHHRTNLWTQIQPLSTAIYLIAGLVSTAWVFYVLGFTIGHWFHWIG